MTATRASMRSARVGRRSPHEWVAAALVQVGRGAQDQRAERAARTGRYVVPAGTRIEVLEVYCAHCRAPYSVRLATADCPGDLHLRVDRVRVAT